MILGIHRGQRGHRQQADQRNEQNRGRDRRLDERCPCFGFEAVDHCRIQLAVATAGVCQVRIIPVAATVTP